MFLTPWTLCFIYGLDQHFQIWQTKAKYLYPCIHCLWKCKINIYFSQGRWVHLGKRVKVDVIGHGNPHWLRHGHLCFHTPPVGTRSWKSSLKRGVHFLLIPDKRNGTGKNFQRMLDGSTLLRSSSILGFLCSPCCPGSLRYYSAWAVLQLNRTVVIYDPDWEA